MYLSFEVGVQLHKHKEWLDWVEEHGVATVCRPTLADLLAALAEWGCFPILLYEGKRWRCVAGRDDDYYNWCVAEDPDPTEAAGKCLLAALEEGEEVKP